MQVHLPLAVCLLQSGTGSELALAVHQVRPDDPSSVGRFVDARGQRLLHHVVVFTPRTYAECQAAIRRTVASNAGARMVGCTRQIIGDVERIRDAMNRLALDRSDLDQQTQNQRSSSRASSACCSSDDSDNDSHRSLADFIESDTDMESAADSSDSCNGLEDEDEDDGIACTARTGLRRNPFTIYDDDE